ncbi:MAG: hypothetical protein QF848_12460 [Planctomycetota bacterium]|nr:hypothetical protein [Planctomycetota bacterium]
MESTPRPSSSGRSIPSYNLYYPNEKNLYDVRTSEDPAGEYAKLLSKWDPDYTLHASVGVSVQGHVDDVLSKIARAEHFGPQGRLMARFPPCTDPNLKKLGLEHYFGKDAKRSLWEYEALAP